MKTYCYFLILLITFTGSSCSLYEHTPMSVDEVVEQGPVLQRISYGKSNTYDFVYVESGIYKVIENGETDFLDVIIPSKFYLRKPFKPERFQYNVVPAYEMWVTLTDGQTKNGLMYQLKDSSIILSSINIRNHKKVSHEAFDPDLYTFTELAIEDIKEITVRKLNANSSIATGAAVGGAFGLLIGLSEIGSNYYHPGLSLIVGAVGGSFGALVGLIARSPKQDYIINSNIRAYQSFKIVYDYYAIVK